MSKQQTETWIQQYDAPTEPGPDGMPGQGQRWWSPLHFGPHGTTTRQIRGGSLTQRWARYPTGKAILNAHLRWAPIVADTP